MLEKVRFEVTRDVDPEQVRAFYIRQQHEPVPSAEKVRRMIEASQCFVTAWHGDALIGLARGVCDGVIGYLAECKLDPRYQGPAAVTHTDGRIEHDEHGIAREMARLVMESLWAGGVERLVVAAWGTEVDFCEELGFRRVPGLVTLHLDAPVPAGSA